MSTYNIYQDRAGERVKIGTFTPRGKWQSSAREIARQYREKHPGMWEGGRLYLAYRRIVNGVEIESEILPMEPPEEAHP